jgi:sulfide:quinone oxidoreductase
MIKHVLTIVLNWTMEAGCSGDAAESGVFAHAQAETAAARVAAEISGCQPSSEFCGDGYCMLEAGEDFAGIAFGNFFAEPSPQVNLRQIGKAWHVGRVLFEKWWLTPPGW